MAKFCSNCGAELNEEQEICLKCGVRVKNSSTKNTDPNAKSKMAAGLLGIFLGQWGVPRLYRKSSSPIITFYFWIHITICCCWLFYGSRCWYMGTNRRYYDTIW